MQELPALIECERNAVDAARGWLDKHGFSEVEDAREGDLLEAFYVLKAFDAENRVTLDEAVTKAEGQEFDPNNYKQLAARLVAKQLLNSKEGRNGGYWLTDRGTAYVEERRARRKL
jgi:hypothetical protein